MPVHNNFAGRLRRYLSFKGRISRKEFLYGFVEIFLFGFMSCLPLAIAIAGMKSSGSIIFHAIALLFFGLMTLCLWAQCALLVKRGHDRGLSGTPMFAVVLFILFFMGNGALEVMTGESYMDLIFPRDRDDQFVAQAIFFAFGIYINFLFWSGLKKGSAEGADEYGPPPTPDEDIGFWIVR